MSSIHCQFVKGICQFMCPAEERSLRSKEKMIHILETDLDTTSFRKAKNIEPDLNKMVKKFSRSAAGQELSLPELLRPPKILFQTVQHLLSSVILDDRIKFHAVVEFITDGLRSVRQDGVIQDIPANEWIKLLPPMIRFHSFVAYKLSECAPSEFDSHLNKSHLNECLKRLLFCYDVVGSLSSEDNEVQDEMEALYLLLNPGHFEPLFRYLSLNHRGKFSKIAFRISLLWWQSSFSKLTRLYYPQLTPVLTCVISLKLGQLRRNALEIMSSGYSSKNQWYPIRKLTEFLLCNNDSETIQLCQYYNIEIKDDLNAVRFQKGNFSLDKPEMKVGQVKFLEEVLAAYSVPDLLLKKVYHHEVND